MSTSSPRIQNAPRNARPVGRRKRPPARALRNPHRRLQRTTLLSFPTAYCIRLLASWLRWGELSLPLALRGEKSSPDHHYATPRRQEIKEILKAKGAQSARSCPAAGCHLARVWKSLETRDATARFCPPLGHRITNWVRKRLCTPL